MLITPTPNCEILMIPQPNWPMETIPLATTGRRLGRYLKEMCSSGSPQRRIGDLYSYPQPSQCSFAGQGAPQWGHIMALSEISREQSRHGFMVSLRLHRRVAGRGPGALLRGG